MQKLVQPLCEAYGVDICFSSQEVRYARTEVDGMQYIAAGSPEMRPTGRNLGGTGSAAGELLYFVFTVDGDTLTYQAVRPNGETVDSFSTKDRGANKSPTTLQAGGR